MTRPLKPTEQTVLRFLAGESADECCWPFAPMAKRTGLTQREVRLACRSLKRKGLTAFHVGLMTDDGDFAGAGYCATEKGRELMRREVA